MRGCGHPLGGPLAFVRVGEGGTTLAHLPLAPPWLPRRGRNNAGQLGLGDTINRGDKGTSTNILAQMGDNLPFVAGLGSSTVAKVRSGDQFACALTTDGEVKCW